METITQHAPGTFCWPELGTTDQQAAKTFYSSLFGWTFRDSPMGPDEVYTIFELGGRDCAALYTLKPEMRKQGIPPHWEAYVSVANADETAARVAKAGGTVMMKPFDIMELGRMAVLQDPVGGVFCVWQAKKHHGVGVLGEPGALAWTQLNATDTAAATRFYTQLFGWTAQDAPMPQGGNYTTLSRAGQPHAGIMPMPPDVPKGTPSHWLNYFAVADVDATAARTTQLEGRALVPPTDIPDMGRFAVLQDPQGAVFAVVKFGA